MHNLRIVDEDDERRRLHRNLRAIVDFQCTAIAARRVIHHNRLADCVVELACRNSAAALLICAVHQFQHLIHALPALSRDKQHRHITHKR
ncbi:hypothetical protein SDC9_145429 [bioreactor metagenome]|uniref:Uncharacterized protein n=1 Tax=bioreactor metagenome TaxID=1076179 RepID=A0A645E8D9_9ZZZZ